MRVERLARTARSLQWSNPEIRTAPTDNGSVGAVFLQPVRYQPRSAGSALFIPGFETKSDAHLLELAIERN